jgi:collagen type I/II/III/V/XI/XXIV/XXVII alpha
VLGSFPVAGGAEAVAAAPATTSSPEPRVAVAGPDSDTVTVLNPDDGREIARVEAAGGPTGLAFAADGRHLYVTTGQGLQVVDTRSWEVAGSTDVALNPTAVAVSADGRTGWVTGDGEVSVLNLS